METQTDSHIFSENQLLKERIKALDEIKKSCDDKFSKISRHIAKIKLYSLQIDKMRGSNNIESKIQSIRNKCNIETEENHEQKNVFEEAENEFKSILVLRKSLEQRTEYFTSNETVEKSEEPEKTPNFKIPEEISNYFNLNALENDGDQSYVIEKLKPKDLRPLLFIQQNLDFKETTESLKEMRESLIRTSQELTNEYKKLNFTNSVYVDYLKNPPLDIIRETPLMQQYYSYFSQTCPMIEKEGDDFSKELKNIQDKLKEITENFSFDDENTTFELMNELNELENEEKRLKFIEKMQKKVKKVPMKPVEREVLKLQELEQHLKENYGSEEELRRIRDEMNKSNKIISFRLSEIEETDKYNKNLLNKIKAEKSGKETDENVLSKIKDLEEKIAEKENVLSEAEKQKPAISSIISKTKAIANSLSVPEIFSGKSILRMHENSKKRALLAWHKRHIRMIEKEVTKKQEHLAFLRESTKRMKEKISHHVTEKPNHNLLLCCPLCGCQRDTVITSCGHTFCDSCVKRMTKQRKRVCGSCGKEFNLESVTRFML